MPYDETKYYDFYKTPSGILTAKSQDSTLKKLLQKCRDEKGLDINKYLYIFRLNFNFLYEFPIILSYYRSILDGWDNVRSWQNSEIA